MLTLSHGYKKPQDGVDAGSVWFPAMEGNIQQLNDHTHNPTNAGNDGAQLFLQTQSILSANWSAASIGGGMYQQTVTMPSPYQYDTTDMSFRLSTGEIWYPTIVRQSANTYQIFCNDNSLTATALYR